MIDYPHFMRFYNNILWKNIISKSDNELVKRVYMTQKDDPSHGDYVTLIGDDFKNIGISYPIFSKRK